jgi:hypothetical protein
MIIGNFTYTKAKDIYAGEIHTLTLLRSKVGGAEDDESLEVFGRPEGVHSEARQRWGPGCGDLPQARDSQATYFNWKRKYDELLPTEMRRLKQLEDETQNCARSLPI